MSFGNSTYKPARAILRHLSELGFPLPESLIGFLCLIKHLQDSDKSFLESLKSFRYKNAEPEETLLFAKTYSFWTSENIVDPGAFFHFSTYAFAG